MALGLGELPADLLEPIGPEEVVEGTPDEPAGAATESEADFLELLQPEITDVAEAEAAAAEDVAAVEPAGESALVPEVPQETIEEPVAEYVDVPAEEVAIEEGPVEEGPVEEAPVEAVEVEPYSELATEMEALAADVEAEAAEEAMPEVAEEIESSPDLTDILESLEDESGPPTELIQTETFEEETGPSEGVISTDAYLADIGGSELDVGLSSGLGDELSALTGGAGGGSRPTASVNPLPEEGDRLEIRRDQTVDKELVKRIIEGIENL
jgi:hypothetical protein